MTYPLDQTSLRPTVSLDSRLYELRIFSHCLHHIKLLFILFADKGILNHVAIFICFYMKDHLRLQSNFRRCQFLLVIYLFSTKIIRLIVMISIIMIIIKTCYQIGFSILEFIHDINSF